MIPQGRQRREPILIVTHGDGTFDVHAENLSVNIVKTPYLGGSYQFPQAEDYLEETLSPFWRKLYFPGLIKASGDTRPLTPSSIQEAEFVDSMLETCDRVDGMTQPIAGSANAAQKRLTRARRAAG